VPLQFARGNSLTNARPGSIGFLPAATAFPVLSDDLLRRHNRAGGAVIRDIVCVARDLAHLLHAHVLELVASSPVVFSYGTSIYWRYGEARKLDGGFEMSDLGDGRRCRRVRR